METENQSINLEPPRSLKKEGLSETQIIAPTPFLIFKTMLQRFLGQVFVIPFCGAIAFLLGFVRKYKIENREELRRQYQEIVRSKEPLIICANHLTFIDSCIIIWALAPIPWYFFNFRCLTWNLPAGDFFKKKFRFRFVAYFSKCIFIDRNGSKEHKSRVLGLCRYLVAKGEVLTIFPEGKRSRTGYFGSERLTRGTGKIIAGQSACRVLCIYVRGDTQVGYSSYPPKGARFHLITKLITPVSNLSGPEKEIDLVEQVGATLKDLEKAYFESKRIPLQ